MARNVTPIPVRNTDSFTRYIRVRSEPDARFVEFDFAIGDPSLFVELIMPPTVFEEFCRKNQVVEMTPEQIRIVDADLDKWRYGEETLMSANHSRPASS
ncbi:MAG: phenol hydroxylase [Oceanospirillaceae bacterium]|nr:phenol hydroxylase [Oceanospirillaceae bacterium]